ncbi:MAG: KGK domain-containing protein [Cyanobacteria bacterium J06641_2]
MDRWEFEPDDVLSLVGDTFDGQEVFKAERIKNNLVDSIRVNSWSSTEAKNWTEDGIRCKLLSSKGGGWKQGRIKITVEFIRDSD